MLSVPPTHTAVVVTKFRDHSFVYTLALEFLLSCPWIAQLSTAVTICLGQSAQLRPRTLLPFFLGKGVLIRVKLQMGGAAAASGPGMCHM